MGSVSVTRPANPLSGARPRLSWPGRESNAEQQVQQGPGAELVRAAFEAGLLQLTRPPGDPLLHREDLVGGQLAASACLDAVAGAVTVVVFGALTAVQASALAAGGPTPWMGLFERVSIAPWLLWMVVLASC